MAEADIDGASNTLRGKTAPVTVDLEKQRQSDKSKLNLPTNASYKVTWEGLNDAANPKNWNYARKWTVTIVVSSYTFISPISTSIVAPALHTIGADLKIYSQVQLSLAMSIFILAYAFGPFLIGPLSEIYGRALVLQLANLVYLTFNVACGFAQNIGQMTAFRFLAGLGGSAPLVIGGGVLADCWVAEERGRSIAIYSLAPLLGPVIGPIVGGFITEYSTWRWVFWATSIADGLVQILGFLFLRETYPPKILGTKAQKLRKSTGNQSWHTKWETPDRTYLKILKTALVRPFILLGTQPIIQVLALYIGFLYGVTYLVLTTLPVLWTGRYHESIGIGGLNYISLGVGYIIGTQSTARLNDTIYKRLKLRSDKETGRPEFRLPLLIPSGILVPAGLLWYGWSAQARLHWIMPNIGILLYGMGVKIGMQCLQTYLVDSYTLYTASAAAASMFYEIPIQRNTIRTDAFKVIKCPSDGTNLADQVANGLRLYDPGLKNTAVSESKISFSDDSKGLWQYRGHNLADFWKTAEFEDLLHLLVWAHWPSADEKEALRIQLVEAAQDIPESVVQVIQAFPKSAAGMQMVIAGLAAYLGESPLLIPARAGRNLYHGNLPLVDKAIVQTVAAFQVCAGLAACHQASIPSVSVDVQGSFVSNTLLMMGKVDSSTGKPDPTMVYHLQRIWVLTADMGHALSTSAFLLGASSLSDPLSCLISALSSGYGILHFGAAEASLRSLIAIGQKENVPALISAVKEGETKLFGYGHRVFKTADPRIEFGRQLVDDIESMSTNPLLEVALEIDRTASEDEYFTTRNLTANSDLYLGLIFAALDFDPTCTPVMMGLMRSAGMMAHWREAMSRPINIWRPPQFYTGDVGIAPVETTSDMHEALPNGLEIHL